MPPASESSLLRVRDLSVTFATARGDVHAARGVSFELGSRDSLAIVGESGSGKSVTCLAVLGLLDHTSAQVSGSVEFRHGGEDASWIDLLSADDHALSTVRGRGIAYVSQDPSTGLNPYLTVRDSVRVVLAHHRVPRDEQLSRSESLLRDVGLAEPQRVMRSYPGELSGGMAQRVMLALALAGEPSVLIADEPTTALDVTTQEVVLGLLDNLRERHHLSLVVISHNVGVVRSLCERTLVLYDGRIMEAGPTKELLGSPAHPYTQALLASVPSPEAVSTEVRPVAGDPPGPFDRISGCPFHPRCPVRIPACSERTPELAPTADNRAAACHLQADGGRRV